MSWWLHREKNGSRRLGVWRTEATADQWIKPPRLLWSEPLPDYSERLARVTGTSEAVTEAKYGE